MVERYVSSDALTNGTRQQPWILPQCSKMPRLVAQKVCKHGTITSSATLSEDFCYMSS